MSAPLHEDEPGRLPWRHALLVLAVCAAVYLPWLGSGGLTSSEGHRAIPGWRMLETGNWWLPELFGQAYLRKPPGMPWAIAASSGVLGQTEFAARLPSALAMTGLALTSAMFGARWFGSGGGRQTGLASGVAVALTPWFWSPGRSAEIEALAMLGTGAAVLLLIELGVNREGRGRRGTILVAFTAGVAMAVAGLAKGPAGFAAIGSGAAVAVAMAGVGPGEPRAVARVRVVLWILAASAVPAVVGWWAYTGVMDAVAVWQAGGGQPPITQGVSEFLWQGLTAVGVGKVLAMGPVALASALPASVLLALPWWRGAGGNGDRQRADRVARAVSAACLLSLLALAALGVHNARYAMPSFCFVPVLAAYGVRRSPGLARRGPAVAGALLVGAAAWIGLIEPHQRSRSGREAGSEIGALLPDGSMLWADHMVEARPEVLWYARQEAARRGCAAKMVWIPGFSGALSLPRRGYLLLRSDAESGEEAAYAKAGLTDRLTKIWEGRVHKFGCVLYRKD